MKRISEVTYCKNQFLIAMPNLMDPHFFRSVTYICEHNVEGAMGIIINQPLDISISDLLTHMQIKTIDPALHHKAVLAGGAIQQERGFVIHCGDKKWQTTLEAHPNIHITTSKDILEAIAIGNGPAAYIIALGFAGWESGQLEDELGQNLWLNCDIQADIFFHVPAPDRWHAAVHLMGVDINRLSNDIGHA